MFLDLEKIMLDEKFFQKKKLFFGIQKMRNYFKNCNSSRNQRE